jgi:ParB family chromosome partitioning protein
MARKNLFAGLGAVELPAGNLRESVSPSTDLTVASANFGGARGAIGAVTRSIEQLKANSIQELATDLVDPSFISDRIGVDAESYAELLASMREHGQQAPILVRPHPEIDGRFQVAYGHRRLRAAKELERPIKAVIKRLSDIELVIAQGQENHVRTDLSFIERARFAASLENKGFDRPTIMAALSVDKTGLSRLISSAEKIPSEILDAIGAAPKTGRDRWVSLASQLEQPLALDAVRALINQRDFFDRTSDERFEAVLEATIIKKRATASKRSQPSTWVAPDGKAVARYHDDKKQFTVAIDKKSAPDFGAFLLDRLPEIYDAFLRR